MTEHDDTLVTGLPEPPPEPPPEHGNGHRPRALDVVRDRLEPARGALEWLRGAGVVPTTLRYLIGVIGYWILIRRLFSPGIGPLVTGLAIGSLYGLLAVGLILIYRTNRIVNFAVAAIGAYPAVLAVLLNQIHGISYWVVLPIVVIGGPLIGGMVDVAIIRRFSEAPRLIVTVATIGIAQLLAFATIYLPIWLGAEDGISPRLVTPFSNLQVKDPNGSTIFTGDYVVAVAVMIAMAVGLATFFRRSRMGIALRASAENADRAQMLGIPVKRVGTVAWAIAGLFGAMTIFLRSPVVGVPTDGSLGYQVLLFALAPAVLAKMDKIPLAVLGGLGVGIIEFAAVTQTGSNDMALAYMLLFILGALLFQKGAVSRALDTGVSTWKALTEFRPVPPELRHLKEVRTAKLVLGAVIAVIALGAPFAVSEGEIGKLSLVPIAGMVAVSLVILSGWAGQVSLGQFAIVGVGAVVAAKLYTEYNQDFWVTLIVAAVAGAVVAVLIGLPALRIQGLLLAVTTLALAGAAESYLFKPGNFIGDFLRPSEEALFEFERPVLWERLDLGPERNYYYFTLAFLVLVSLAAWSFRRHHSGRVLIATRDNTRGAQSYGISIIRSRLAAFAVSGAIAAVAGVILVYQQLQVDGSTYGIGPSVAIFVSTVIGGLTSLPGAVAGAVIVRGIGLFGDNLPVENVSLLVTGPGLLLILLFLPGGFAQGFYQLRDGFLRWVAERHDILVPSLVADRLVEEAEEEANAVIGAEEHVEELDRHVEPTILCPVCERTLALADAADHEHLRTTESVST